MSEEFNTLKEVQDRYYELLVSFDEFCKKNDIHYFLAYGTLLGAIRHKGFIPWDDDIDIGMTRDEYNKLRMIPKDNYPDDYFIRFPEEAEYFWDFVPRYCKTSKKTVNSLEGKQVKIGIDIFILDKDFDSGLRHRLRIMKLMCTYSLARGHREKEKSVETKHGSIISLFVRVLEKFGKGKSITVIVDKYRLQSLEGTSDEFVYFLNVPPDELLQMKRFYAEDFKTLIEVQFRDRTFPAPAGYDRYLRIRFGDYMKLPPKEEQKAHHEYLSE